MDRQNRSGGKAGAGGYNFQAHATVALYVSLLSGHPFAAGRIPAHWAPLRPKAVSMETGSGGDDLRVLLGDGSCLEAQVRRSASSGAKLFEAFEKIIHALIPSPHWRGALICGDGSSLAVRVHLQEDLARLASGRRDDIRGITLQLEDYLRTRGIDLASMADRLTVIGLSEAMPPELPLLAPNVHSALWKVLLDDAHRQIQLRGRRTLHQLVEVIWANGLDPRLDLNESAARELARYTNWLAEKTKHFRVPGVETRIPVNKAINLKIAFADRDEAKESTAPQHNAGEGVVEQYYAAATKQRDRSHYDAHFVLDFNQRVVAVGGPGAGKSLLLRRIAHRLSCRSLPALHVRLRDLVRQVKNGGRTYTEALEHSAFDGFGCSTESRKRLVEEANFLIADGLDECGEFAAEVADWLAAWLHDRPNVQALVSTRPVGFDRHWFESGTWHHTTIEPFDDYRLDDHLALLLEAMGVTNSSSKAFPSIRKAMTGSRRDMPRWSSPLAVALAGSLIARGMPLPDHRAELLRSFLDCYRPRSPTERVASEASSQAVLDRALEAIGAELRMKPSIESRDLVNRVAERIAGELGTTPLAATEHVSNALDFWEQRALIERLHVGHSTYYAFAHMQLCEVVAADYWNHKSEHDTASFERWVLSAFSDPQQQEVLRFLSRTSGLNQLIDALCGENARALFTPSEIATRAAEMASYAGTIRSLNLGTARQHTIEVELLAGIASDDPRMPLLCAERWMDLPWKQRPETAALVSSIENTNIDCLCTMALKLRHGLDGIEDASLIEYLRARQRHGLHVTSEGKVEFAQEPGWGLHNKILVRIFEQLTRDASPDVLAAAQFALDRQDYSSDASVAIARHAKAASLDISVLSSDRQWKNMFSAENMRREREQDLWFLEVIAEVLGIGSTAPRDGARAWASELRDLGAVWSALSTDHVPVNEFLDLSDPPDSQGLRAVLRAIMNVLEIDTAELAAEINLARGALGNDPSHSLGSHLPKVPVSSFVTYGDSKKPSLPAEAIVDALFHESRAVAFTAARLIQDQSCGGIAPLIESHLQDSPEQSLRFVSLLAERIWGPDSIERLREELNHGARPGLNHFAQRVMDHPSGPSDADFYSQVAMLIEQEDVYEAAEFAKLLCRFDPSLHSTPQLRRLFDYWVDHQPPFRNGEYGYTSPLASIGSVLLQFGALSADDRAKLERFDRSEIRTLVKRSANSASETLGSSAGTHEQQPGRQDGRAGKLDLDSRSHTSTETT